MDLRVFSGLFAFLATTPILADEPPAPAGASWKGSISLGAELDERALPQDDKAPPPEKPGRIRVGFSASWSFSLNGERVEANLTMAGTLAGGSEGDRAFQRRAQEAQTGGAQARPGVDETRKIARSDDGPARPDRP